MDLLFPSEAFRFVVSARDSVLGHRGGSVYDYGIKKTHTLSVNIVRHRMALCEKRKWCEVSHHFCRQGSLIETSRRNLQCSRSSVKESGETA